MAEFTGMTEKMIETVKSTEQMKNEYRFISAFEMDTRYYGRQKSFADGSYQTKLETTRRMKLKNYDNNFITEVTGLSNSEVEDL